MSSRPLLTRCAVLRSLTMRAACRRPPSAAVAVWHHHGHWPADDAVQPSRRHDAWLRTDCRLPSLSAVEHAARQLLNTSHRHTNGAGFLTGQMPLLLSNQQCQRTIRNIKALSIKKENQSLASSFLDASTTTNVLYFILTNITHLTTTLQSFYGSSGFCLVLFGWVGTRKVKPER